MTMALQTGSFGGLTAQDAKELAVRSMQIMANGTRADFDEVVHPDAINHEAKDEPPEDAGERPGRVLCDGAVVARVVQRPGVRDPRGRRRG